MGNKLYNGLIYFSRIFVGALFIVSGMVKANDPVGFSYKLEEYFSEGALGWTFFEPYALFMGVLVSCGEMILGLAILFGGKPKLTVWLLLLLTVFFGFLTYYTAQCDPAGTYTVIENGVKVERGVQCVTDCGCFGDALKGTIGRSLTPWESFTKDMILLVFVLVLFVGRKRIQLNDAVKDRVLLRDAILMLLLISGYFFQWLFPIVFVLICFGIYWLLKKYHIKKIGAEWTIAIAMSVMSFGFAWYCYANLPVKDFTPYAVGKSIPYQMKTAEDLGLQSPQYGYMYIMTNVKTGKTTEVRSDRYLAEPQWQDTLQWKLTGTGDRVTIAEGYEAPIPALSLYYESDSGEVDIAYDIIENPGRIVFLLVAYNLEHTRTNNINQVNKLYADATKAGHLFFCASSAGKEQYSAFAKKYNCKFPFVIGDEQGILKPMVRSNPGLLVLKNGIILGKWHNNNLPDYSEVEALLKK